MKKIIALAISLCIILTFLAVYNQNNEEITLESMRKVLTSEGYTIVENYTELYKPNEESINSVGGFSFVLQGTHGNVSTPVLEFEDNASAESYAEYVNASGHFLAIINDIFLTVTEAHHGIAHDGEKIFLENLITGKSIK